MKLIKISETGLKKAVSLAKDIINNNGIIIHPTDTIYGLAGNILEEIVYLKIMQIKQRDLSRAISWQISDYSIIKKHVNFKKIPASFNLKEFCLAVFPGAITIVLPVVSSKLPKHLNSFSTIGFRMPDHKFCNLLASSLPYPLTTTSANISGLPYEHDHTKIIKSFEKEVSNIFIDEITSKPEPSTVIQIDINGLILLRESAIKMKQVEEIYKQYFKKL
ncbi:MAG: Sua5/YciO/YrdC/YwlC family protein [Calditrichia bacterium]|nr:Sua5/YciO/YrdC/YwlC family protein [Calditrichia bacterium]